MTEQSIPSFSRLMGHAGRIKAVNVGANPRGRHTPYQVPLHEGTVDVVGFEPNLAALAALNAKKGPNETYLPYAVADGQPHVLNICYGSGMTSLLVPNPPVLALFQGFSMWSTVVATETVQTVRLDDVPETEGADFIHLDIQGAELMALTHAPKRLADAVVVQCEVEFLPMYVGQPLFADVDVFMRERGFMFHRFFPLTSRPVRPFMIREDPFSGMGQALWADAVYVRDLTRLDLLADDRLLAMASILHDCYGSADLVLNLLAAHDRRRGGRLGHQYMQGLQNARPMAA